MGNLLLLWFEGKNRDGMGLVGRVDVRLGIEHGCDEQGEKDS
jgi:hypothetical protein